MQTLAIPGALTARLVQAVSTTRTQNAIRHPEAQSRVQGR
jgi:hypothetical protein